MFKKSDGLVDLPTQWDQVGATKQTVMNDERDFSRPRESFMMSTAPSDILTGGSSDILQANDNNSFIIQIKKFMKNNPLGPAYSGDLETPQVDSELLSLLKGLESTLQIKTGESVIGTIVSGNDIDHQGFLNALKLLGQQLPKEENDSIIQFQKFFDLPMTGIIDDKLVSAAKAMEEKIARAVNNPGAYGLLWDDSSKTFKTNLSDLQEALNKIRQFQASKIKEGT